MTGKKGWSRQEAAAGPVDNAGKRLMGFAWSRTSTTSGCGCRSRG